MISRITLPLLALAGGLSVTATTARAREAQPVPEDVQQRLLDRFGDDGIDANADGVLTRQEIRTFIHDEFGDVGAPRFAHAGRRRGFGRGQDPIGDALRMIDRIDAKLAETQITDSTEDAETTDTLMATDKPARGERMRARLIVRLIEMAPEADANGDGTLDAQELADLRAAHQERVRSFILDRHPEADTDGDGVLSDEEFDVFVAARNADRIERMLERHPEADVNGDGTLSEDEIKALRDEFGPPAHRGFRGPGRGPGPVDTGQE